MTFESGADDETRFGLLSGRGLWGNAAIAGLLPLSVPLYDLAAEAASESSCSVDAEVELEAA